MNVRTKERVAIIGGLLVLLIISGTTLIFSLQSVSLRVKSDLTSTVRLAGSMITPRIIDHLNVSSMDLESVDYQRLQEQFLDLGEQLKSTDIRGIYVMKVVNGNVLFVVDTAPTEDPWHSEPGVTYDEPPPEVAQLGSKEGSVFVGPYTDEYGTFYSIFISNSDDARANIVIGGDVDIATYDGLVRDRLRMPVAIIVGVISLYFALYLYLVGRFRKKRELIASELARHREEEERSALLMNVKEGVIACDGTGIVTFVNKYAQDLVGVTSDDSLGKDIGANWSMLDEKGGLLPPENQPIMRAISGDSQVDVLEVERTYLRKTDGSLLPVLCTTTTIELPGGVKKFVLTLRDFTKEAEIDRMKSDFISIAVHQIRTPLTGLMWTAELLSDGAERRPPEEREAINGLTGAIRHLNELVRSLLNITRIESGRLSVEPRLTNISRLVERTVKESARRAEEKKQRIQVSIDPNVPELNIDPHLTQEVIKNLYTNAVKYSPNNGTVEVNVALQGSDVVISIKDDGYGILESDSGRIFSKFYRGKNIVGLEEEGTGLGLYFAKQVAEASGGRLWYVSKEGAGSTFYFSLPLAGSAPKTGETHLS